MAPTKAPWAEHAEDELEELEGEDTMGSLGAYVLPRSSLPQALII